MDTQKQAILPSIDSPEAIRRRRWRMFKDRTVHYGVTLGGNSVIAAILLIFIYLLYVVFPLLLPASMQSEHTFPLPDPTAGSSLYLDIEESGTLGFRLTDQAHLVFFDTQTGAVLHKKSLALPVGASVTSFSVTEPASGIMVLGLSNGLALLFKRNYKISYPNDVRTVIPVITYPLGKTPLVLDDNGQALRLISVQIEDELTTIAGLATDGQVHLAEYSQETSFLSDESEITQVSHHFKPQAGAEISHLLIDKLQENLYLARTSGLLDQYEITDKESPTFVQNIKIVPEGVHVSSMMMLNGGISVLIGDSRGQINQWFNVRDEAGNRKLTYIRSFSAQTAPIIEIMPEQRRKGFVAIAADGTVGVYHSTAHQILLNQSVSDKALNRLGLAPRANFFLAEDAAQQLHFWSIANKHPEVSLSSLWGKVWYEDYSEPSYTWQSSSASNDFEPKFSLTPLSFGTLKAAFYAMLLAVPLAVFGAIYTAYFMSPGMRSVVKPGIEIMEALPTVILGFLAGLWLAPIVEEDLPAFFAIFFIVPFGVLMFAWFWHTLPKKLTHWMSDSWTAALLMPVVIGLFYLTFALSPILELYLFDGNMRLWLDNAGINFDQRNSLVVGFAMGFAIIPTIFSITEDAIFSVPKHLTIGSLALGATPWQTMIRVVILTASPGIFSAIMIGMGRAVGETMIVLMATGNTAIMDMSIFEGMRTLSANIAVEVPESEHGSTHYRILFLAGLVLFMFTFFVNTMAEMVRHRLRKRYGSL